MPTTRCPNWTRKNKSGECVAVKNKSPKSPKQKTVKKTKPKTIQMKSSSSSTVENMNRFKIEGMPFLQSLNQTQINDMIHLANKQFHAYTSSKDTPVLTDNEFDIVKEYLAKKYPSADALQEIGAQITAKQKVTLPVSMPSMDKIKPDTNALSQWREKYKGPYVLSCKLDGVSGLYYSLNNSRKLYTRGDGSIGQDISSLLSTLKTIPTIPNVIVRGEFIVSKNTFERKYKTKFANIRNMVAGLVNRKSVVDASKDIDFIAYEVIEPVLKPSEQMKFLQSNGFKTVSHITKSDLSNDFLSDTLIKWREQYEYEIDGVIVGNDSIYKRTTNNPDHAFAFKMVISDQVAETHVIDVIWTASKDGFLKPRVRVNPVRIGGVTIEYATGFNGQFIESNKIGIGAVIQLVRSGDVIPYIKSVTTPADIPKMPSVSYSWNNTHVDVLLTNKEDDPVVLEKQITLFFTTLEVDGLSIGNVRRLIKAGYNNVPKILQMTLGDFEKVEGFQQKLSQKIHKSIHEKIEKSSLAKLLVACGCLGRGLGEKKVKPILHSYPEIFTSTETSSEKIRMLMNVDGIGKENAKGFVENIPKCLAFFNNCQLQHRFSTEVPRTLAKTPKESSSSTTSTTSTTSQKDNNTKTPKEDHPLYGKKIVFTGFRDKQLMSTLEDDYKVSFGSSVSKNTFVVVTKGLDTKNAKVIQAGKLQIPIMEFSDFKEKWFI